MKAADVMIDVSGALYYVRSATDRGRVWLTQHLTDAERWQDAFVVEEEPSLVARMRADGLAVSTNFFCDVTARA